MSAEDITREDMWAKQSLRREEIDYALWNRDRIMLRRMADVTGCCTFVVDVYKCKYTFASSNFAGLLGYDSRKLEHVEHYGDYLESRIHPDDLARMKSLQTDLSGFIYSLPAEERNNYKNIFTYRVLNAKRHYVNVTSRHQVLETSSSGKAWLIMGMMDIDSDQRPLEGVACSVLNLKTGDLFSPGDLCSSADFLSLGDLTQAAPELTNRELEILRLMKRGLLSKEIACRLNISIHTVNIHRQNLLRKLGVRNSIEAIDLGRRTGLIL